MKKILVMGLPGSGKSYLADKLRTKLRENTNTDGKEITVRWYESELVRKKNNNWDFSIEGRIKQSELMADFSSRSNVDYCICELVAPTPQIREKFSADYIIWLDTIKSSEYPDTDNIFIEPDKYDFRITEKVNEEIIEKIAKFVLK
jgi:adenylylsulfate kinase